MLSQALSGKDEEMELKVEGDTYSNAYEIRAEIFLSGKKITFGPLIPSSLNQFLNHRNQAVRRRYQATLSLYDSWID